MKLSQIFCNQVVYIQHPNPRVWLTDGLTNSKKKSIKKVIIWYLIFIWLFVPNMTDLFQSCLSIYSFSIGVLRGFLANQNKVLQKEII